MNLDTARTEVCESAHEAEAPFELANLFPKRTGLPFVVWISVHAGAPHDVLVKVSAGSSALSSEITSVALRPNVHVVEGSMRADHLKLLTRWIELNRDVLLRYWDGQIDTVDAVKELRRIE